MKSALALAVALLGATPAQTHSSLHHSARHQHHSSSQNTRRADLILENITSAQQGYVQYDDQLLYLLGWHDLVPLPQTEYITIDGGIKMRYRFCAPVVRTFLVALGKNFYRKFHHPLKVNSALRTKERQIEIRMHNPNAIESTGPAASLHERANTFDLAYLPLQPVERAYVESWLDRMKNQGDIDYQKEKLKKKMYHIVTYRFPVAIELAMERD